MERFEQFKKMDIAQPCWLDTYIVLIDSFNLECDVIITSNVEPKGEISSGVCMTLTFMSGMAR